MSRTHTYRLGLEWTGNTGSGTASYRGYERTHVLRHPSKPELPGSSDAVFRGDPTRWNPEELLVASLSACHMLVYLHEAALAGVVVTAYADEPVGEMAEDDGGGWFSGVLLQPTVTVAVASMVDAAQDLHGVAHRKCFIAASVAFPVSHRPVTVVEPAGLDRSPRDAHSDRR
jgi:organic hydroperoxide reductase OsmC/OhrA